MDIGVVLPQLRATPEQAIAAARRAEGMGADSVWVIDHVVGFRPELGILEPWTMLAAVAMITQRVDIGAMVLCQSFRNPALLAKMITTLDLVSNGRVRALVGAGWFETEYKQYGWDFPRAGIRIEQLRDTVRILRGMLTSANGLTYEGKHHRVREAVNLPAPAHRIGVEVGGAGDRILRLIAAEGDGWNCPAAALASVDERIAFLRNECARRGRSLSDLRLSVQIVCAVGDDNALAHPLLGTFAPELGFVGSIDSTVDRMRHLVGLGFSGFHCIVPPGPAGLDCLERLVNQVRPRVT